MTVCHDAINELRRGLDLRERRLMVRAPELLDVSARLSQPMPRKLAV